MPMTNVEMIDMVIGILLVVSLISGYCTGLVMTVARILVTVVSYIGAGIVAKEGKEWAGKLLLSSILNGKNSEFAESLGELAKPLLQETAEGLAYSLLFFVSFFVIQIVLMQLIKVLKIVDYIPVVGKINKLGGAVAGFLWMFVVVLLVSNVFFTYVPKEARKEMGITKKAAKETVLFQAFVPKGKKQRSN